MLLIYIINDVPNQYYILYYIQDKLTRCYQGDYHMNKTSYTTSKKYYTTHEKQYINNGVSRYDAMQSDKTSLASMIIWITFGMVTLAVIALVSYPMIVKLFN